MNMHYINRAKDWYERAEKETDEFVKFILFFIAFEVLTKISGQSTRDIKQEMIFFENIPKGDLESLINELDRQPLQNMNPEGNHRWNGKITSFDDTDGIVEFIIRARNNLFHGDKGPDESRDIFIVKYGNKLLSPVLKEILKNYDHAN